MSDSLSENLEAQKQLAIARKALEPQIEVSREIQRGSNENGLLREVGRKLEPDGHKHVASICVHIYKKKNSDHCAMIAQSNDLHAVPEVLAQTALKEMGLHLMYKYGRRPPKKVGDVGPLYENESKLWLPPSAGE